LLGDAFAEEVSSISAPEKQALDAERRRASEAKFAAWQKRAPALAQKFNRQLRPQHHQVLPAAPPVEEAFPSAPASLPKASEEQWQKDYEAFMALQKAKAHPGDAPGTSLLTLSGSQEGLEAKVAKVLEETRREDELHSAGYAERLRQAQWLKLRKAKEERADRHLAKLEAQKKQEDAEVALLRVEGGVSQATRLRERAREILAQRESGELQQASRAEQERFRQWQQSHETAQSQQQLFSTQREAVSVISREVQGKHRKMFEVIQELQKQQRQHVKQLRLESDSGRFDRWQQSPQGSSVLTQMREKRQKQKEQELAQERLVSEARQEGNRFDRWKLQHQGRRAPKSSFLA